MAAIEHALLLPWTAKKSISRGTLLGLGVNASLYCGTTVYRSARGQAAFKPGHICCPSVLLCRTANDWGLSLSRLFQITHAMI